MAVPHADLDADKQFLSETNRAILMDLPPRCGTRSLIPKCVRHPGGLFAGYRSCLERASGAYGNLYGHRSTSWSAARSRSAVRTPTPYEYMPGYRVSWMGEMAVRTQTDVICPWEDET
jgi:hypothetical protein